MWYNEKYNDLADQLSKGVLNEMKTRIETSNINKEKLELGEETERMKDFFEREIQRYKKRKQTTEDKAHLNGRMKMLETEVHRCQSELESVVESLEDLQTQNIKLIQGMRRIINKVNGAKR
jgi:hypothetical protein